MEDTNNAGPDEAAARAMFGAASKEALAVADAYASGPRVIAARTIAETLMVGFDECAERGCPLKQVQKTEMVAAALLAYDGFGRDAAQQIQAEETFRIIGKRVRDSR